MNALDRAHNGDYRAMHIKSKCPKCKYREPWQRMGISFIVYCVVFFLFIGICLVAMGANNKNVMQIIIGGVVIALPFAVLLGGIVRRMICPCNCLKHHDLTFLCREIKKQQQKHYYNAAFMKVSR